MITDVGLKTDWLLLSKSCESCDIHLFFYTVGEPGTLCCIDAAHHLMKELTHTHHYSLSKKGEYVGTPIFLFFFQEVIFQILENLMATSFHIVPEKNVSCSWINYFCYHLSYYDYHMLN